MSHSMLGSFEVPEVNPLSLLICCVCLRKWEEPETEHALLDPPPSLVHENKNVFGKEGVSHLYSPR